jgi:LacI family transcriptional regulator
MAKSGALALSTSPIPSYFRGVTDYIFASMIESAQVEARRQGFFILTGSAPSVEQVQPLLDEMLNRRVDGLLVLNPRDDDRYRHLLPLAQKGIPVVYLKNSPLEEPVSSVCCDDQRGGYQATKYLLELGHTSIATIMGPENEECTMDRLEGYRQALLEADIEPEEILIAKGDWTAKSGSQATQRLLVSGKSFSAIFAQNDRMAMGAIRALREAGMRVPQDISVIGYDDIPLASYFDPPSQRSSNPWASLANARHGFSSKPFKIPIIPLNRCVSMLNSSDVVPAHHYTHKGGATKR